MGRTLQPESNPQADATTEGVIYAVGEMDIRATVYGAYTGHETFDIGRDEGMPGHEVYKGKGLFKFTEGQLHKVVFDILEANDDEISPAAFTDLN